MIRYRSTKWQSPGLSRAFVFMFILFVVSAKVITAQAVELADADVIPHVSDKAREQFNQYRYASGHKAFAIAPGGAWYWLTELESEAQAKQQTLAKCQAHTQQKCVLYALNDHIVFDAEKWPTLWGPYVDAKASSKAATGTRVGQRFPDLSWLGADGKPASVSDLKGKVSFLHFWGSWCPPCMREFPSLKKLHAEINKRYSADIEMVLMQLREPFGDAKQWAKQYGFSNMPLCDSGVKDSESATLNLKDGTQINDRVIARVFPSTYVLDRNGLVIFSHHGPVNNWLEYLAFFDHAVKNTATGSTLLNRK